MCAQKFNFAKKILWRNNRKFLTHLFGELIISFFHIKSTLSSRDVSTILVWSKKKWYSPNQAALSQLFACSPAMLTAWRLQTIKYILIYEDASEVFFSIRPPMITPNAYVGIYVFVHWFSLKEFPELHPLFNFIFQCRRHFFLVTPIFHIRFRNLFLFIAKAAHYWAKTRWQIIKLVL